MRVSVVSNVWLSGRERCRGELIELSEAEAERLAIRSVVEFVYAPAPAQVPEVTPNETQAPARASRKRKAKK